ncbi:hypothetical protein ACI2OX_17440 [Bacillus sp. N9]
MYFLVITTAIALFIVEITILVLIQDFRSQFLSMNAEAKKHHWAKPR